MSGDGVSDVQATKEPSSLLGLHKMRASHSDRDLPSLIASHPDGGDCLPLQLWSSTVCGQESL